MQPSATNPEAKVQDQAPLDEGEINRLIAAARAETYRPSDTPLHPTVDTFRPKSLLDLALLRRDADKAAMLAQAAEDGDAALADNGSGEVIHANSVAQDTTAKADAHDLGIEDAVLAEQPTSDPEDIVSAPIADGDDPVAAQPDRGAQSQDTSPTVATTALPVSAEMLDQIRSEAFAAGRAEAEAEAQERLTSAIETLEAATHALQHPNTGMLAKLQAEIADAVLRLASDRAGLEIDTMPAAFVERIETLADRIHCQATQAVLRLHPDDHQAIAALIAGSDSLATMRVVTSPELSRGDVDLTVDGLRISDRILGQPTRRKSGRASPKPTQDKS